MTEQEAKKLVKEHRETGDLIDFCLEVRDESFKNWDIIFHQLEKDEKENYGKELPLHIKELVKLHKQNGDFEDWTKELEAHDKRRYLYVSVIDHINTGDIVTYLKEVYDASDQETFHFYDTDFDIIYDKILSPEEKEKYIPPMFQPIIESHREKGDLIDFLIDGHYSVDSDFGDFFEIFNFQENWELLTKVEKEELENIYYINNDFTLWNGEIAKDIKYAALVYAFKLSHSAENTSEYKRYVKIRSKLSSAEREELDSKLSKMTSYEIEVYEHRKADDLMDFCLKDSKNKEKYLKYLTDREKATLKNLWEKHLCEIIDSHRRADTLYSWINELRETNKAEYKSVFYLLQENEIKKKYAEDFDTHRKNGDFFAYLWKEIKTLELSARYISGGGGNKIEKSMFYLLIENERKILNGMGELEYYFFDFFDLFTSDYEGIRLLCKMSEKEHDSLEYKEYVKIRDLIKKVKEFDKYRRFYKAIRITLIPAIALVLILIGAFSINRVVTKDARMAKKEAQRIEKQKVQEAKDLEKAQKNDLEMLEKLGSKKLALHELLTYTNEPKLYTIAPMSYDTKKFAENNSHDKGMFGSEKDNSTERLAVLEGCITDFTHKVDELTGVSFLDRTKIAQIEKEHKFQLGDWSNDKKTAEVGKALNANIMLFFDKFAYIDSDYRFEAKFVDINTMQSASFNIVYKNPKKKIVTPENVGRISFKDFTANSVKDTSFEDELSLKAQGTIRTVQKNDLKTVSPLGNVAKLETSEFDVNMPKSEFASVSSIIVDGFGGIEVKTAEKSENYTYTFEPCDLYIKRIGNGFYTDGKIGTLTIKTDSSYEKLDVFTVNDREYFLKLGTVELPKVTVNYYLQMVKN